MTVATLRAADPALAPARVSAHARIRWAERFGDAEPPEAALARAVTVPTGRVVAWASANHYHIGELIGVTVRYDAVTGAAFLLKRPGEDPAADWLVAVTVLPFRRPAKTRRVPLGTRGRT